MIGKLEILLALAKEQHFGRAAASLGMTQPSLSTGLRQLEAQLGVKLVHRGARFGGFTPEGQRALEWARRIVGDARQLAQEMRFAREGLAGHIRLAVVPTALIEAAHLTADFARRHPKVGFSILSASSEEILHRIEALDADAGITYLADEWNARMTALPLYMEDYVFLCRPAHVLAGRDALSWADLAQTPLCLLSQDMQNRRILNGNFAQSGTSPLVVIDSNSTTLLLAHVVEGGFATILPRGLARFLGEGRDLRHIPMTGGVRPQVGLIVPYQEVYTPVLDHLLRGPVRVGTGGGLIDKNYRLTEGRY